MTKALGYQVLVDRTSTSVAGNNTLTITQAAVDMLKMEVKYKAKG